MKITSVHKRGKTIHISGSFQPSDLRRVLAMANQGTLKPMEDEPIKHEYTSGGRNPNWEPVCQTCQHREPDREYWGHG
jgi:hypothetical protein